MHSSPTSFRKCQGVLLILLLLLSLMLLLFITSNSYSSSYCKVDVVPSQAPKWDSSGVPQPLVAADTDIHSDKWAVVTTINDPTPAITKLGNMPGWKVVVVGDLKTPPVWKSDNCVYLSPQDQKTLGYEIHDHLPYNSYARKNIGYLYAIQHGAQVIYETDDDNELTGERLTISPHSNSHATCFEPASAKRGKSLPTVNPYAYFGRPDIWPRGYPMEYLSAAQAISHPPTTSCHTKPLIQQSLADLDPDVDAIFRLTHEVDIGKIRFEEKKPVSLPKGVMSPFNSQNTLFHKNAFWGLLIPITTPFRVCDIWRGYWSQRILWDVGGNLEFGKATVDQVRNVHNYIEDLADEVQLYTLSGKLVDFLVNWKDDSPDLFERILNLSWEMARNGFWKSGDVGLTRAWLRDLHRVGYRAPSVVED